MSEGGCEIGIGPDLGILSRAKSQCRQIALIGRKRWSFGNVQREIGYESKLGPKVARWVTCTGRQGVENMVMCGYRCWSSEVCWSRVFRYFAVGRGRGGIVGGRAKKPFSRFRLRARQSFFKTAAPIGPHFRPSTLQGNINPQSHLIPANDWILTELSHLF